MATAAEQFGVLADLYREEGLELGEGRDEEEDEEEDDEEEDEDAE